MGPSNRFRVACGVVATVPTGDAPHEVAVAPDGRRAVGTNYGTRETPGSNLTVIRTAVGAAQRVALALDRSDWPEMVGNIGGDDTVFVACDTATNQKILIAKIERARS